MFKQIIVRSDFIIPDVYIKGNTEEIEEAIKSLEADVKKGYKYSIFIGT